VDVVLVAVVLVSVVLPVPSCFRCGAGMERKDLLAKNVNIFKVPSSPPNSLFLKVTNLSYVHVRAIRSNFSTRSMPVLPSGASLPTIAVKRDLL